MDRREKAHHLLTQIVNSLTAKMEIGAPMAAMYLLKNPDHYTDHEFRPFYWKTYVHEVHKPWMMETDNEQYDKVILNKTQGQILGLSPVFDYIYRPSHYEDWSLYDWFRLYTKKCKPKMVKSTNNSDINQCESNINDLETNIMDIDVDTATDELEEENQDYFSTDSLSDDDSDDDSEITQGLNSEEIETVYLWWRRS